MDSAANPALKYVEGLYLHLLHRRPSDVELQRWVGVLARGLPEREAFLRFVSSKEYKLKSKVQPGFPSGHFYSPVVDPAEIEGYWRRSSSLGIEDINPILIDLEAMTQFWRENEACIRRAPFTDDPSEATRYYYNDGRYPSGDAIMLMCMINARRPKHIIEIGSGFSSAVMLDTADLLGLDDFRLTCIDPYADRLRSLMRAQDHARVTIMEQQVQVIGVDIFDKLEI